MNVRSGLLVLFSLCALGLSSVVFAQDHSAHQGMNMNMDMGSGNTTIRFSARVGDSDVSCGIMYESLGSHNSEVELTDFRLYISNVRLINAEGEEVPLELTQDEMWQHDNVALLDFEDGSAGCADSGNAMLNTKIVGSSPDGEYTGLVFDLGVPDEMNHMDTTTAPTPLNIAAMWWGWQGGYKFLRVDMMADGKPWFIHLGSTGCESPNEATAPESPCSSPNRVEVRMGSFNAAHNFVVVNLDSLVSDIDLSTSVPEPPGCMSFSGDPDCAPIFKNLGLALDNGTPLPDVVQTLFSTQ
ncbi:MAG: metallo-mystery pair system four-Cys motif protein [Anaerolineae bacterium]